MCRPATNGSRCITAATASSRPVSAGLQATGISSNRNSRQHVIAAGRRPRSEQASAEEDDARIELLKNQSLADLKQYCKDNGLSTTGKKADLIARIQQQLQEDNNQEGPAADTESNDAAADEEDQILRKLSLNELRQQCEEFGLRSSGNKADLIQRIKQHFTEYYQEAVDQEAVAPAAAPAAAAADVSSDIDVDELIMELEAEFAGNSKQELVAALQNKGLPTDGNKAELVTRLAEAVARE